MSWTILQCHCQCQCETKKQVTSHSETSPIDLADPHPDLRPDLLPDLRDIICVIVFSPSCDLQPLAVTWRNIDARDPTRCLTTPLSLTDECSMKFCWLSLTIQMLVPKYLLLMKIFHRILFFRSSFSSSNGKLCHENPNSSNSLFSSNWIESYALSTG